MRFVGHSRHPEIKWAQREDKVFITVVLADTKDAKVNLAPEGVFSLSATAGQHEYDLKLELADKVNVDESKINIGERSIFCILEKAEPKWWNKLLNGDAKTPHFVKVDWGRWVDEDDEAEGIDEEGLDFSGFGYKRHMGGMGVDDEDDKGQEVETKIGASIEESSEETTEVMERLGVKSHGGLSPDGTSLFDHCPSDIAAPENNCSYFVDSSRVFNHTTETKPVSVRLQQQHTHLSGVNYDLLPPEVITNEIIPNVPEAALLCKNLSGVIKSIDACKQLSSVTSLGPDGANKIVIKHQDKLFLNELEIQHPAAKLLVLAGKEQQKKFGDGAKLVVSVAGQHLEGAKELITMGLNLSEIIEGYKKASSKLGEILEGLVEEGSETMDVRNKDEVILRMKAPVSCRSYENDILCPLIAEACIQVCPEDPLNFNVDNVRVAKLLGKHLCYSETFRGMVLKCDTVVGSIKRVEKAKVVVIAGGVDTTAKETKGSVLIHSDEQLENYAKTEEAKVEELIKAVAELGAEVIVSGAAVGERALHFCERYKIMVLKIATESELEWFRRTTNAVDLLKIGSIVDPCYLGYVDSIKFEKSHGAKVTVTNEKGGVSTVLLGTRTNIISDELKRAQRAVDNGVNSYKALCKDSRIVPGAGATEIEIARKLKEYSLTETGSDKHAIAKYAESFELIPKTLAENAYLDTTDIISTLYEEHTSGNVKVGIDLEEGACNDVSTMKIWDLYTTKYHALQNAADAVCNILGVDQMSTREFVDAEDAEDAAGSNQ